jgi:hypothetical protein
MTADVATTTTGHPEQDGELLVVGTSGDRSEVIPDGKASASRFR